MCPADDEHGIDLGSDSKLELDTGLELQTDLQSALGSDLRLHAQRVEIGQAEMLTDALLARFDDLDHRLNTYIRGSAAGENLRKGMQAYLSKLNSNVLIPLHFRLKVLKRFEEQLDLFDAEMTAAILNAHKIGIDMVQKEAQREKAYYPILLDMVSNAIELAGRLVRDTLGNYEAPAVITIRQVFDLMRLGMLMLPELGDTAEKERKRFYLAVVRYELMRNLDFYSKKKSEQDMLMEELEHHIRMLVPYYLPRAGIREAGMKGYSLLVTNLSKPNDTAQVMPFPPQTAITDYILIPLDDFLDKLVTAIDRAEKVLKNPVLQSKDFMIEKSLHTTVIGGNAILDALRTKSRAAERQEYGNAKLIVGSSLEQSFRIVHKEMMTDETSVLKPLVSAQEKIIAEGNDKITWTVMNVSGGGLALEKMGEDRTISEVGAMVGLHWKPHRGEPQFGFVCWIRYPKSGEQQVGIRLYRTDYLPVRAVMLAMGEKKNEHRAWTVLATFEDDGEHYIVFPDKNVFKGMVFSLDHEEYGGYFKVISIQTVGPNYAICTVGVAAELS